MRALTIALLVASACYGTLPESPDSPRYNCAHDMECPSRARCAGVVRDDPMHACTGSEGFGRPGSSGQNDSPADVDWYFICDAGNRYYPFCVDQEAKLQCGQEICEGKPENFVCIADPLGAMCLAHNRIIPNSCDNCDPPAECRFVFTFDEDSFSGGLRCIEFPAM